MRAQSSLRENLEIHRFNKASMPNLVRQIFRGCTAFSISPGVRDSKTKIRKPRMIRGTRALAIPMHLAI
jgi:hypothetical protein